MSQHYLDDEEKNLLRAILQDYQEKDLAEEYNLRRYTLSDALNNRGLSLPEINEIRQLLHEFGEDYEYEEREEE